MKRIVEVDFDSERREGIMIGHPEGQSIDIVADMAVLCEGLCTLIHQANTEGSKKDSDSLADCINHLQKGFIDSSYKTEKVIQYRGYEIITHKLKSGFQSKITKGTLVLTISGYDSISACEKEAKRTVDKNS